MLQYFNAICEFRQQHPGVSGNNMNVNDPQLVNVKEILVHFENYLRDRFQNYRNVYLEFAHSKGENNFPFIMHVSILPPNQRTSNGIYVVICFDKLGRGALVGCAESKTNPKGIDTVKRKFRYSKLQIDVDGSNENSKYNNTFENPREFLYNSFGQDELENHIIESLDLCLKHLNLIKDPDIETIVDSKYNDDFDPNNIDTAKEYIAASIARRRGQKSFRDKLLVAYNNTCAISGCKVSDVLEAAHIVPYNGTDTNKIVNGLLLRTDLHTLFDLGLISIDPDTYKVSVSQKLQGSSYYDYQGLIINLPINVNDRPSKNALKHHFKCLK